jgi:hypothetical protein
MTRLLDLATDAGIEVAPSPEYPVAATLPEPIQAWIEQERTVYRRWASTGESPASRALMAAAVEAGHRRPGDLVALAAHRPCYGWAARSATDRQQLARALSKMADQVLAAWAQQQARLPTIDRVVIWQSDATEYEIHARGTMFRLTPADLLSPSRFAIAYLSACQIAPEMPKPGIWRDMVNGLLASATIHDLSQEGNQAYFLEVVRDCIRRMPVEDELTEEVSRRPVIGVTETGEAIICLHPLIQRVKAITECSQPRLVAALVTLLAKRGVTRFPDGTQVRTWVLPPDLAPALGEKKSCDTTSSI